MREERQEERGQEIPFSVEDGMFPGAMMMLVVSGGSSGAQVTRYIYFSG